MNDRIWFLYNNPCIIYTYMYRCYRDIYFSVSIAFDCVMFLCYYYLSNHMKLIKVILMHLLKMEDVPLNESSGLLVCLLHASGSLLSSLFMPP